MNLNYDFDDSMSLTTTSYQVSENHSDDRKHAATQNPVDMRNFYPRSSAVMHSVPKSLLGVNNLSFLRSGCADDKSISTCSTAVETLASQLNENDRSKAPKCVINALNAEQKFKVNCFNSFRRFSTTTSNQYRHKSTLNSIGEEECRAVPAKYLPSAMKQILRNGSSSAVYALMDKFSVNDNDMLAWKEFECFAYTLFKDKLANTKALKLSKKKSNVKEPNEILSNAYQSLMRKQRAADAAPAYNPNSSVDNIVSRSTTAMEQKDKQRYSHLTSDGSDFEQPLVPHHNNTIVAEGSTILGEKLGNVLVPSGILNQSLVDVVRWGDRKARETLVTPPLIDDKGGTHSATNSFAPQHSMHEPSREYTESHASHPLHESSVSVEDEGTKSYHYRLPTQKMKLNSIVNHSEAYSTKWLKMKKIRDEQSTAIEKRNWRQNLMRNMTSISIAAEKEIVVDRMRELKYEAGSKNMERYLAMKADSKQREENIAQMKEIVATQKKKNALKLNSALYASSTMSRSMLLEEQADRNTYKVGSVSKLSSYSSTIVDIPAKFDDNIKNAKTYVIDRSILFAFTC